MANTTKLEIEEMFVCHECEVCSRLKPQALNWGHECWGYTGHGKRITACESHIEPLPVVVDMFEELNEVK